MRRPLRQIVRVTIRLLCGDALEQLRLLEDESVQCCITSPPYWGLRDYGTGQWEGGDPSHEHVGMTTRTVSGGEGKQYTNVGSNRVYSGDCVCGARRIDAQLGLERTPDEYVAKLVEVFREVRRVLRGDGTLWLNLGDCYHSGDRGGYRKDSHRWENSHMQAMAHGTHMEAVSPNRLPQVGLKDKDLVGIPWRVAFALQADGWWLRSDIIWSKSNPMPESVTDRPTKAHEYLFLLTKSARYYFDAETIKEPATPQHPAALSFRRETKEAEVPGQVHRQHRLQRKPAGWDTGAGAHGTVHRDGRAQEIEYTETTATTRNRRTVWTIPTQPFPEAHFATFPEALVEPCIAAGSRPGDTVLDPFAGSGTVGVVALRAGRDFIGIDLSPRYVEMARRRIEGTAPLFAEVKT